MEDDRLGRSKEQSVYGRGRGQVDSWRDKNQKIIRDQVRSD